MHAELDRLRKDLKQKIFVGEPGGETFVSAAPERRIESLREQSREPPPAAEPRRRESKKGQTTVADFWRPIRLAFIPGMSVSTRGHGTIHCPESGWEIHPHDEMGPNGGPPRADSDTLETSWR